MTLPFFPLFHIPHYLPMRMSLASPTPLGGIHRISFFLNVFFLDLLLLTWFFGLVISVYAPAPPLSHPTPTLRRFLVTVFHLDSPREGRVVPPLHIQLIIFRNKIFSSDAL